jgi:hypothetical protein
VHKPWIDTAKFWNDVRKRRESGVLCTPKPHITESQVLSYSPLLSDRDQI